MGPADDPPCFEQVDWEELDRSRRRLTVERLTALAGVGLLLALSLFETVFGRAPFGWTLEPVDWVFLLAVAIGIAYGVVPLGRRRQSVRRILRRLRSTPAALLAGLYLLAFVGIGLFGPAILSAPELRFQHAFHPPIGFTSQVVPAECLGGVSGEAFDRRCHASLTYPLGTNERGHPMGYLLVAGARVALYVALVTAVFVVPVAATVGLVAGIRGGLVDDVLMSGVDVQLCIPAILLYFVGYMYWNPSLLLLLTAFGLLSWGGIARLVRSEVLQRREDGHVLVARSLGASWRYVARRHILPNVTNTLVPAVFQLLALFVLVEAGVAFLGFHDVDFHSWGTTISESVTAAVDPQVQSRASYPAYQIWWVSTLPALALAATVLSFKLLGDGLRDALDPRGEN